MFNRFKNQHLWPGSQDIAPIASVNLSTSTVSFAAGVGSTSNVTVMLDKYRRTGQIKITATGLPTGVTMADVTVNPNASLSTTLAFVGDTSTTAGTTAVTVKAECEGRTQFFTVSCVIS